MMLKVCCKAVIVAEYIYDSGLFTSGDLKLTYETEISEEIIKENERCSMEMCEMKNIKFKITYEQAP